MIAIHSDSYIGLQPTLVLNTLHTVAPNIKLMDKAIYLLVLKTTQFNYQINGLI